MSALKIYGTPASRTVRVLWMAKELGLEFESISVDFKTGETDSADYKKINPNGRIPTLQDGDLTLCESMAINLYLAKKYPGPLTPKTVEDDGRAIQWTIWGVTEVEGHFVDLLHHREMWPEPERDEGIAQLAEQSLKQPLGILDGVLSNQAWLLGDAITVADINVAGILVPARRVKIDLSPYPNLDEWLTRCMSRPAAVEALKMRQLAAAAE